MESPLLIACADIGSVRTGRFGWAARDDDGSWHDGDEPETLAQLVSATLRSGSQVALGFECPLFVPVSRDPNRLTSARTGEGNRPWSAGAGAGVLATGLTEVVWILRRIRELAPDASAVDLWDVFHRMGADVLLWEAFVTSGAKGADHRADARIAVEEFGRRAAAGNVTSDVTCEHPFSLLAAAMLTTGWSDHVPLLATSCIVVRAAEQPGTSVTG